MQPQLGRRWYFQTEISNDNWNINGGKIQTQQNQLNFDRWKSTWSFLLFKWQNNNFTKIKSFQSNVFITPRPVKIQNLNQNPRKKHSFYHTWTLLSCIDLSSSVCSLFDASSISSCSLSVPWRPYPANIYSNWFHQCN